MLQMQKGEEARDFLEATRDNEALRKQRLRSACNLKMHQKLLLEAERWSVAETQLRRNNTRARAHTERERIRCVACRVLP